MGRANPFPSSDTTYSGFVTRFVVRALRLILNCYLLGRSFERLECYFPTAGLWVTVNTMVVISISTQGIDYYLNYLETELYVWYPHIIQHIKTDQNLDGM